MRHWHHRRKAHTLALVFLFLCLGTTTAQGAQASVVLSFAGDCTIGGMPSHASYDSGFLRVVAREGFAHPFSGVYDILSRDDLTLVNLEGTFTEQKAHLEKSFVFRAPPEYAQVLTLGSVEAVNVSNNHIHDYLANGRQDTLQTLAALGIVYSGDGIVAYRDVNGIRVGMAGYSYPHRKTLQKLAETDLPLLRAANCDVIILSIHAGTEEEYRVSHAQQDLARGAIDLGVDIVVGHHPHVVQGVELYKGRPIFYSLGNFVFGGNVNPKDWDSMLAQVTIERDEQGVFLSGVRLIPCRISGASRLNDFRPVVAEGDEAARILAKIRRYSPGDIAPSLFDEGFLPLWTQLR